MCFTSCIVYRKVSQGVDFIMFLLRVSFTEMVSQGVDFIMFLLRVSFTERYRSVRLYNVFTSCIVYRKVSQCGDFIMFLLRVSFTERYRRV